MRTRPPALRTLPSSTCATASLAATVAMSVFSPLNANEEVRAITRRPGIRASTLSSSSDRPSEKYSLSGSPLMLTKGSTAIDGSPAAGTAAAGDAPATATDPGAALATCPAGARAGRKRFAASRPVAATSSTTISRLSLRAVAAVIEALRSTSCSRLSPSGVSS